MGKVPFILCCAISWDEYECRETLLTRCFVRELHLNHILSQNINRQNAIYSISWIDNEMDLS